MPYDDSAIKDRLDRLESKIERLENLCAEINTNIAAIQVILDVLQKNDYITAITPIVKDNDTVGYTLSFSKSPSITIYNGQNGKDGKDGYTPQIGVKQDSEGIYYWTIDGDWLLDSNGNKIQAIGVNGQNGKDGTTPRLKIENGYWYISYDNGTTWTILGQATGKDGDTLFAEIIITDNYVDIKLSNGTQFQIPTYTVPDYTQSKRRSLLIQFAGTRCPNDPYWSSAIMDLQQDENYRDKFIVAVAHTYNDDIGSYHLALNAPYNTLAYVMGVNSYPTAIFDMHYSYGNNGRSGNKQNLINYIDSIQNDEVVAGISATSSLNNNIVTATVNVTAYKDGEYRVGAWLVEDGIIAPQNNSSGIFDYDFDIHNAVIRIADSNLEGGIYRYRGYSVGELNIGQTAKHEFTMELNENWNANNCRLIFFVTDDSSNYNVVNAVETDSLNDTII